MTSKISMLILMSFIGFTKAAASVAELKSCYVQYPFLLQAVTASDKDFKSQGNADIKKRLKSNYKNQHREIAQCVENIFQTAREHNEPGTEKFVKSRMQDIYKATSVK